MLHYNLQFTYLSVLYKKSILKTCPYAIQENQFLFRANFHTYNSAILYFSFSYFVLNHVF